VSARYDRAIRIIEHLGCCRTNEHPPKDTSMRRHNDEIEPILRDLSDLCRGVSGNNESWVFGDGGTLPGGMN
jgi:hypothetical protein